MTNPDLDGQLTMACATGVCAVPMDTIIVLPGSYTRIGFNAPLQTGLYVWHCHLVEHEVSDGKVCLYARITEGLQTSLNACTQKLKGAL